MTLKFQGQLEIDVDRGVLYFHYDTDGTTKLRICGLPRPMPRTFGLGSMIDITLPKTVYIPQIEGHLPKGKDEPQEAQKQPADQLVGDGELEPGPNADGSEI